MPPTITGEISDERLEERTSAEYRVSGCLFAKHRIIASLFSPFKLSPQTQQLKTALRLRFTHDHVVSDKQVLVVDVALTAERKGT